MATDIVALARDWIGTPYRHQASLQGVGCDCLGLLRGVWRAAQGDEPEMVPPYSPDWAERGQAEVMRDAFARHLTPVAPADMAAGDFVLFRMRPRTPAKHCGIVAGRNGRASLIHARQNKRVSEEDFSSFWRARLAYIFRV